MYLFVFSAEFRWPQQRNISICLILEKFKSRETEMCRKPHNTPNPDLFSPQCFTRVYPEEKGKAGERSHCVSQRRKRCVMIPVRIWPLAQTREREIWRSRCLLPSSDVSGPGELKTPDQSVCFKSFSNTNSTQHLTQLWVTHKINKLLPVTGLRENKARRWNINNKINMASTVELLYTDVCLLHGAKITEIIEAYYVI